MQAHNRYWATDNDYRSLYPFTCSTQNCLPSADSFWNYLFGINQEWGLAVYEQDWLSTTEGSVPMVQNNTRFGREWLLAMGRAAYQHDVSIQCECGCFMSAARTVCAVGLVRTQIA